jgi:hypothetical protein
MTGLVAMKTLLIAAALALPLAACATSLKPLGDAGQTVAMETGEGVAYAAGVAEVYFLKAEGAKIFTTAGGDPAINGLYTYYAQFSEEDRSWRSFMVGDFNEITIVQDTPTQTGLRVSKSSIDANGDVRTETQFLLIPAPAPEAKSITVLPSSGR